VRKSIASAGGVSAGVIAVALSMFAAAPTTAVAGVISIPNPGGSGVIGARIRWGGSGFEAAIRSATYCSSTSDVCATLNPGGTPVWNVDTAYAFKVEYKTDGSLYLGVDFNDSNGIEGSESLTYNVGALNGQGFDYLQVFGNNGTANSQVEELVINGNLPVTLAPGPGSSIDNFYNDTSGGATAWLITGYIKFLTVGAGDENPSWNFNFRSPGTPTPVPEPGSLALGSLALLALGAARRRKST
jgi:MYXO-CTERM domain-containing protein